MKPLFRKLLSASALIGACLSTSAATIGLNPNDPWQGFMNVFNLPSPFDNGAYQFGSSWGTADLRATFAAGPAAPLTLSPNTIGDPNPYWYIPSGGPGAVGNKIMDANMYVEVTGALSGQPVTFEGGVLANTLVGQVNALGLGWTAVAFIKDFAPDYSSSVSVTAPLNPGSFGITLNTINDPLRHVQYGFEVIGPDVWATDVGQFGSIQIVPEPASVALLGLGTLGALCAWRRRK
jgi:hypothetical protein